MPEDKLTRAERVRLEAFSQAISSGMAVRFVEHPPGVRVISEPRPATMDDVFKRAELIEAWLKKATDQ